MKVLSITENENNHGFYPTPETLIEYMIKDLDFVYIQTVLEPSAGKGDIIRGVIKKYAQQRQYEQTVLDIDAIEKDNYIRQILKYNFSDTDSGVHIVFDDFLKYEPYKKYDLIVMNPPFSEGDRHLLKAIEVQNKGGAVICLLNAETIKNPYTNTRQLLIKELDKYNASIEYLQNCFTEAERKTDVEIALIKINIPHMEEDSDIFNRFREAEGYTEKDEDNITNLEVTDYIKVLVNRYNVEVKSTLELIRQYNNLKKHMLSNTKLRYKFDELTLNVGDKAVTINRYLKNSVRQKYWSALLDNHRFIGKLTSSLQEKYRDMLNNLVNYEFCEFNINNLVIEMNNEIRTGIETAIIDMFDKLTAGHSWYPECNNNRHYFDGWASNKAHKINKKVILPCWGVFGHDRWDNGKFKSHNAINVLEDIEKILNYLDGGMTRDVDLHNVIQKVETTGNTKNIECKFFKCNFYKKGTIHITFTNLNLLEKFNIYASRHKKWLPPNYGRTKYQDMSNEEKNIINEFQGREKYEKVYQNSNYFLDSCSTLLSLGELGGPNQ